MTGIQPVHPRDDEAAEYALGTSSSEERRAFEREMAHDKALAAAAVAWQERLEPLAEGLPPVEPGPALFASIDEALTARAAANVLSFTLPAEVKHLQRSRTVWRAATACASAIAAALAFVLMLERPGTPEPASGLVAVVNRSGDLPALIVRVDQRTGVVQVRSVSAETPAASSLELWSIAPGGTPHSLGVVGQGVTRVSIPAGQTPLRPDVTIAVTVEPPGGSPSGNPTGAVVYSGKLIAETP